MIEELRRGVLSVLVPCSYSCWGPENNDNVRISRNHLLKTSNLGKAVKPANGCPNFTFRNGMGNFEQPLESGLKKWLWSKISGIFPPLPAETEQIR